MTSLTETSLPNIQMKSNKPLAIATRNLVDEYFQKYRKHECAICFKENIKKIRLPCCGHAFDSSMAYCIDCLKKVCSVDQASGVGSCPTCFRGFKIVKQTCVKAKLYHELTDREFRERYTQIFAKRR